MTAMQSNQIMQKVSLSVCTQTCYNVNVVKTTIMTNESSGNLKPYIKQI